MSPLRVGTRIHQTTIHGRIRRGVVDSTLESGLRVEIGILFDGDDVEDDAAIQWFQPHELAAAGIAADSSLRFPRNATELASAGLCPDCWETHKGILP